MNLSQYLSNDDLAIFLFHGVIDEQKWKIRNYTKKHLEAAQFRKLIQELQREGNPLSMDDVLRFSHGEKVPKRSYAITFDDGFENNLTVASPILREYSIPATLYVTTGFVESNGMSWIDRIEYCFENSGTIRLQFPWRDSTVQASMVQEKIELLQEIRREVKKRSELDVPSFVSMVFRSAGLPEIISSRDPLDQKLTWSQVKQWSEKPNFIVGGHGHSHQILSFLSFEALKKELDTSLALLKDKSDIETHHYSYPEGLSHCYDQRVIEELKKRGIACSPTAQMGTNRINSDPFRLKRIMVA